MKCRSFFAVLVALLLVWTVPATAAIVQDANVGTLVTPYVGDVIDATDELTVVNNADIYATGYGVYTTLGSAAVEITNNGIIYSESDNAIDLDDNIANDTLVNSEGAQILVENSTAYGIDMGPGNDTITNSGTIDITYSESSAITFSAGDNTFTNTSTGVVTIAETGGSGIKMGSGEATFTNAGEISIGTLGGMEVDGIGIHMGGSDTVDTLVNSGSITIENIDYYGIYFGSTGDGVLTNEAGGEIVISDVDYGIQFSTGDAFDDVLTNSGTITINEAYNAGIVFSSGNDTLINNVGAVINIGDPDGLDSDAPYNGISMGSGDETLINHGTINIGYVENNGFKMGGGDGVTEFTNSETGIINIADAGYNGIIFGSDAILTNAGTIDVGSADNAIDMDADSQLINSGTILVGEAICAIAIGSDSTLTNSGTITIDSADNFGILGDGGDETITNSGTITISAAYNGGINFTSGNDTLINEADGIIRIGDPADSSNETYNGISMTSGDATLINHGEITLGYNYYNGIRIGSGDDPSELTNTGTLSITYAGCNGIVFGSDTVVTNSGLIEIGEAPNAMSFNGEAQVTNEADGTITVGSADYAFYFRSYDDTFVNEGTINVTESADTGIYFGSGNDTFTTSGALNFGEAVITAIDGGGTGDGDYNILNLQGSDDLTIDGDIVNFDELNKSGTGSWTLNDEVVVYDQTSVTGGTLIVEGMMNTANVDVAAGGTVGGSGTISEMGLTFTNSGTVAPGSSIGTLTIEGQYFQTATGDLEVELDDVSTDLLDIAGTATVDGTVSVIPEGSITDGNRYEFLTTDAGLDGEFASVSDNSVVVEFTLEYDEFSAYLVAERALAFSELAQTPEQMAVAQELDDLFEAGDEGAIVELFNDLNEEEIADAIESLSPVQYSSFIGASQSMTNIVRNAMISRMGQVRVANKSNTVSDNGVALARLIAPERRTNGWSAWAKLLGQIADQDESGNQPGYEFDSTGVAFGFDNQLDANLVMGLCLSTMSTDIDFDRAGQSSDADNMSISMYGTHAADNYYIDMSFALGRNDYESERFVSVTGTDAKGDTHGSEYSAYIGGGYALFAGESWTMTPTASLAYTRTEIEGFTEKGADPVNLTIADMDTNSVVTTLGARCNYALELGSLIVEPELRLEWAHEYGNVDRQVDARFANSTATFSVEGAECDRDSAIIGVGTKIIFAEQLDVIIDYDGEFRSDFEAHQGSVAVRYYF